ncbi:Glycosyl transferase family 2 [Promicromonospora umidemergens]|nr:Glycosyl transferase family 2 [Promicromonospora umidemergens]
MTNDRSDLPVIAAELQQLQAHAFTIADVARRVDSRSHLDLMALLRDSSQGLERNRWSVARAHVLGVAPDGDDELDEALETLLEAASRKSRAIGPRPSHLLGDLLIERRRPADLRRVLPRLPLLEHHAEQLRIDLANPVVDPSSDYESWTDVFNELVLGGVSPIHLLPAEDGATPFDRLHSDLPAGSVGGDLVTVIVSSFRPGPELLTSVRSVVRQTWRDLEIVVVDDASGPEYADVYREVADLDPRVRVLVQAENAGTYAARNHAIDEAEGVYVTFQDSDDWAHPERIERSVAAFGAGRLVSAVRTNAVKLSDDLVLARRTNANRKPAAATLMFRREQAWASLGSFDLVRKAADTEFHLRVEAALPGRTVDLDAALQLVRMSAGSLSRDEIRSGWRHPARLLYHSATSTWHDEIRRGASAYLGRDERRFPAPRRFGAGSLPHPVYDMVVLGDWRSDGPLERDAAQWIEMLATANPSRRIALVHVEGFSLESRREQRYGSSVRRMLAAGVVEGLAYDEDVQAERIVCIDPTVLSYLPRLRCGLRAPQVVVIADRPEDTPRAPFARYDADFVERIAKTTFGGSVVWSPRGVDTSEVLAVDRSIVGPGLPVVLVPQESARISSQVGVVAVALGVLSEQALAEASVMVRALVSAGLDVRMRTIGFVKRRIERDVRETLERAEIDPRRPPMIFLPHEVTDSVVAAAARDLVVVAPGCSTAHLRTVVEALSVGTRVHVPSSAPSTALPTSTYESSDVLARQLAGPSVRLDSWTPDHHSAADAAAVEAWYAGLSQPVSAG